MVPEGTSTSGLFSHWRKSIGVLSPEGKISDSILKLAAEMGCCDRTENEGSVEWWMAWSNEGSWQPCDTGKYQLAESHLLVLGLGPCSHGYWTLGHMAGKRILEYVGCFLWISVNSYKKETNFDGNWPIQMISENKIWLSSKRFILPVVNNPSWLSQINFPLIGLEKPDLSPKQVHFGERNRASHVGILKMGDTHLPIPPKDHLHVLCMPLTRVSLALG